MSSLAALLTTDMIGEHMKILAAACLLLITFVFIMSFAKSELADGLLACFVSYSKFFYASFLKPHTGDVGRGQQGSLESFYEAQVRHRSSYCIISADNCQGRRI